MTLLDVEQSKLQCLAEHRVSYLYLTPNSQVFTKGKWAEHKFNLCNRCRYTVHTLLCTLYIA